MPARRSHTVRDEAVEVGVAAAPLSIGTSAIYAGTCSWADTHFVKEGNFYPPQVAAKPAARLRYYATVFPTIEIDATYYALIDPALADRWVQWTPAGFIFHVKAFGLFTGHAVDPRRLPADVQALLSREQAGARQVSFRDVPREVEEACWVHFGELCRRLDAAGRLGYVLFQFPRWYTPSPGLYRRLERLPELLAPHRVAVEFRHRSWLDGANRRTLEDALRRSDLIYTIVDEPDLPWTVPPDVLVTSDWALIRFHGRNAAAWAKRGASTNEVYDYLYTADELRPWADTVREVTGQAQRLFLMFNNHYRGASARNAQMLVEMLQEG